jgi:acyl-coenzyme A synthetase/AMP-(fatty) acid ligase
VAFRRGRAIEARQFLAEAAQLAALLPAGAHVLNVCADRYRFTVGFAACLMTQRVSLLPSTHSPQVIRELAQFAADVFCLTDQPDCAIDLPRFQFPQFESPRPEAAEHAWQVPRIPADQLAAIVFTSGSTGTPLPYHKTWGKLERCVRDGAPLLRLAAGGAFTLLGTVPAQHMYGFESTVLLALLSGNAFTAERPFYPADICAAVAAVPRPRALISTPLHLRALLRAGLELPPLDLIVSATAPLAAELARQVEATFRTRLVEIYGSTETGQLATRHPAAAAAWRLWPGVRLTARGGQVFADGGHLEQPTPLCDVVEITGEDEFLLHGRTADLVNVAGKRSSFSHLNAQLNAIAGVVDGAFFMGAAADRTAAADGSADSGGSAGTGIARLAAVVVAPTLTAAQVTEQLRQRLDPAFLPRPLLLVDRLPRNATGKLPRQALQALAERRPRAEHPPPTDSAAPAAPATRHPAANPAPAAPPMPTAERPAPTQSSELRIAVGHASFAGHFPGFPILPGAVLLDEALHEIERSRTVDLTHWRLASSKFLQAVRPGDALTVEHSAPGTGTIHFVIRTAGRAVATGTLSAIAATADRGHGA